MRVEDTLEVPAPKRRPRSSYVDVPHRSIHYSASKVSRAPWPNTRISSLALFTGENWSHCYESVGLDTCKRD